jgi:heat shock protein HslJ
MKTKSALLICLFALISSSCSSNKIIDNDTLFNTTWELEFISEPGIPFNTLYPNKKPIITFDKITKKVSGNNSCNGYAADYTLVENSITFGEPGPTTMQFCGEGEKIFLDMMRKINKYSVDQNGKLNLMVDDVLKMRFKETINR